MPEWLKGTACKAVFHGFESRSALQSYRGGYDPPWVHPRVARRAQPYPFGSAGLPPMKCEGRAPAALEVRAAGFSFRWGQGGGSPADLLNRSVRFESGHRSQRYRGVAVDDRTT